MKPITAHHANFPFALISTPISKLSDEIEPDMFRRCASDMANIHNMLLRGLNSIYQQARYVTPEDEVYFVQYCMCFYELLHVHHNGEEQHLFPIIEDMTGDKTVMMYNIEQHHSFQAGLEQYVDYLKLCINGIHKFDGAKLIQIIDSFGEDLAGHLSDEISTILELDKYGDVHMEELEKCFEQWANKDMKALSITGALTWGLFNHDKNYENGLWKDWPPAPPPLIFVVRWVTYWGRKDLWKFASCDPYGRLRHTLYATPE